MSPFQVLSTKSICGVEERTFYPWDYLLWDVYETTMVLLTAKIDYAASRVIKMAKESFWDIGVPFGDCRDEKQ